MSYLLGIDQGTSGTKVVATDPDLTPLAVSSRMVASTHGLDGSVEQDPHQVLDSVVSAVVEIFDRVGPKATLAGFDHQGETVMAWDRETLEPLTPAIVWSDRRADAIVANLTRSGHAPLVAELSGNPLDAYFCAAKYAWLMVANPRLASMGSRVALGTLDVWLLRQLGIDEATDLGTASRTQLTTLGGSLWDEALLEVFGLPETCLPRIVSSIGHRGELKTTKWPSDIPLTAVTVDQPAALVGNGCIDPGATKVTFGTGAFVLTNAGRRRPAVTGRIVTSVGWSDHEGPVYVHDGGVFAVGSGLDWLGGLGIDSGPEAQRRLSGRPPARVKVIPALYGLGAPHWDRTARAAILDLDASTTADDILQAYLDAVAFRVGEIVDEVRGILGGQFGLMRVDGGLSRTRYLLQRQADVLGMPLGVGTSPEATAIGIAALAGSWDGTVEDAAIRALGQSRDIIEPRDVEATQAAFREWQDVIRARI